MSCGVVGVPFPARPLCGTVGTGIDGRTTRVGSPVDRPPPRNAIRGGMTFERCLRARSVPSAPLDGNGGTGGKVSSLPCPQNRPATHTLPPSRPRVRFASMGRGVGVDRGAGHAYRPGDLVNCCQHRHRARGRASSPAGTEAVSGALCWEQSVAATARFRSRLRDSSRSCRRGTGQSRGWRAAAPRAACGGAFRQAGTGHARCPPRRPRAPGRCPQTTHCACRQHPVEHGAVNGDG